MSRPTRAESVVQAEIGLGALDGHSWFRTPIRHVGDGEMGSHNKLRRGNRPKWTPPQNRHEVFQDGLTRVSRAIL